jgi:hypothetical protein
MMMLKGQNGIAKGCAAQTWRTRQKNLRGFLALHLSPSAQPSHINNPIVGFNTVSGNRTEETLFSDYRSIK